MESYKKGNVLVLHCNFGTALVGKGETFRPMEEWRRGKKMKMWSEF